jgi:predicted N-formylglutamate amidohydrolase
VVPPALLGSHRAWDPGALSVARRAAAATGAALHVGTVSRLLVDLNRSLHHPRIFSRYTRVLPVSERSRLLTRHWAPYRAAVERDLRELLRRHETVVHLSVHSFAPRLAGVSRTADVGLLYDPARPGERGFCVAWQRAMREHAPALRVRRNYPYRGVADGLVQSLRQGHAAHRYFGVELELNQRWVRGGGAPWAALQAVVVSTLVEILRRDGPVRGRSAAP